MDAKPAPRVAESVEPAPAQKLVGGRPSYEPTERERRQIRSMSGLGLTQLDMCQLIVNPETGRPIDGKTLRAHFKEDLAKGRAATKVRVGRSLVQRAVDLSHPQGATCAIWYSKTQMGWKETVDVNVDSRTGVLVVRSNVTPSDWIEQARTDASEAIAPGEQKLIDAEVIEPDQSD